MFWRKSKENRHQACSVNKFSIFSLFYTVFESKNDNFLRVLRNLTMCCLEKRSNVEARMSAQDKLVTFELSSVADTSRRTVDSVSPISIDYDTLCRAATNVPRIYVIEQQKCVLLCGPPP